MDTNKEAIQYDPQKLLDLNNTKFFFEYLKKENQQNVQSLLIEDFIQILKINRYMSEYFSTYENKSIYIFLFQLYVKPTTSDVYKQSLINLIKELILNIEADKSVFEYLFQKFSTLCEEEVFNFKKLYDYLVLLHTLLGDTENILKPTNYYACPGEGSLNVNFEKHNLEIGYCLTFILNFKIGFVVGSSEEGENSKSANLISITFSNNYKIDFDLKYPVFIVVKKVRDSFLKTLPSDEWINLVINIVIEKTPTLYFFVNGENHLTPFQLPQNSITNKDQIKSLTFFNNFYGEVGSITMMSQTESGIPGVNSSEFLQGFKQLKEGLWKKRPYDTFIDLSKSVESSIKEEKRKRVVSSKKNSNDNEKDLKPKTLYNNLIFIFTPFSISLNDQKVIENVLHTNNIKLNINGNIRLHQFYCYQKHLKLVNVIPNILPIAEMFLLYPKLLYEKTFDIYLKVIETMLKFRNDNMETSKENKIFQILSLLFEKFPKNVFTEKIMKDFIEIGKCMFNFESICSSYFKYILLNEKILAKYSEGLEIKFWDNMMVFCQADSTLIEKFIEMNRLCLILRFYDRNKYKEMCCKEHLFMVKKEFIGEPLVMNPTMAKKLSQLEGIVNTIINGQDPNNSVSLFKLLTLDLSPCLTKFILNIFIKALQKKTQDNRWKNGFLDELTKNKFEVIIINTFIHSLLEIRIVILQFLFELHQTSIELHKPNYFKNIEKMLKTCLVPQSMFYFLPSDIKKSGSGSSSKDVKKSVRISTSSQNFRDKIEGMYKPSENVITDVDTLLSRENTVVPGTTDNINTDMEEKIFIFETKQYEAYIDKILDIFSLWALGVNITEDFGNFNIKKSVIKHSNFLEILFSFINQINDIKLTMKYLQFLELIIDNEQNAYLVLLNKKVFTLILDLAFKYFQNSDKSIVICFNKGKALLSNIVNNTINYVLKNHVIHPCGEIDIIFLWGNQILMNNTSIAKDFLLEFIHEILFEILTSFKKRFEPKMGFSINNEFNPKSNFILRNYLLLINQLFRYSFKFYYDQVILTEGISFIPESPKVSNTIQIHISAMRINTTKGDKISEQWLDYPFFDDIYKRISPIWSKANLYKNLIKENKLNKVQKYEEIRQKLILDKQFKNLYRKELDILCYEEKEGGKEVLVPFIKSISIALMSILSADINGNDFLKWLKEFKYFTRFLIIAPTNLIRNDQLDYYNSIQEICSNTLISCICCWKDLLDINSSLYKTKIESSFKSTLIFIFVIIKYQLHYKNKHKINIFNSTRRNDLVSSGVYTLFVEKLKDKNGNSLVTTDKTDNFSNHQYEGYLNEIKGGQWNEAFFENRAFKEKLESVFFSFKSYKTFLDNRSNLLKVIKDEVDESYKSDILLILPLYENELAKYSNNSLETNKKIKNKYMILKKQSFSWRGFWSKQNLFFKGDTLKTKLMNHYTKNLMRPLLVPIIDVSYYLPEFSGFDTKKLFNPEKTKNTKAYKLTMDIDKILKQCDKNSCTNVLSKVKAINNNIANNTYSSLDNIDSNINSMIENSGDENYLRLIYMKSNPVLALSYTKISNNLDFGKEEEFSVLKRNNSKKLSNTNDKIIKNYFLGCLVKTSHHIKGVCFIDDDQLNFKVFLNQKTGNSMSDVEIGFTTNDDDYDQERHTCFGSYFVCHPRDKDIYKISINYNNIKWLFRRRYYYKNSAIEIYTTTNKTYYFNFKYEEDREAVVKGIISKFKEAGKIIYDLKEPKDIFENVVGYQNNSLIKIPPGVKKRKRVRLSKTIKKWAEWELTNYELLMWLNLYANRSYNDISQYPVFPWVLKNYDDPLKTESQTKGQYIYNYRDMSLPMGMMTLNDEGERRKETFMETYDTLKNETDGSMRPYIYGSNYSCPMYVCHFLMRLFPFTHISIELQGNKFDDPNRLFLSVQNAFFNSITQKTDVRELIPEFYYLPEMFYNINDLNMGIEENGKKVNDVLTPCKNNPYEFIQTMRNALESDTLSYNLHNWMDLIFGYKAKGKEAEAAFNLFTEASYQEDINIATSENKESLLRQVEFGLIPTQVMTKECPKREKKEMAFKEKQIMDPTATLIRSYPHLDTEKKVYTIPNNVSLIKVSCYLPEKLALVLNNGVLLEKKISYSSFNGTYTDESNEKFEMGKFTNYISDFYANDSINNKIVEIFNYGKNILMGGFYDGTVKIITISESESKSKVKCQEIIPIQGESPIVAVCASQEQNYLFLGNTKGNIAIYKYQEEDKFEQIMLISDQYSFISHIYCNDELNIWLSTSKDGYINLYTLPLCELARVIKIPSKSCSYAFAISSPLPSVLAISEENNNSEMFVYSINGKIITKKQEYFSMRNPLIIKDMYSFEYLAFASKDSIYIYNIPELNIVAFIDSIPDLNLFCTNEDKTLIYAFNKNGSKICLIRDDVRKNPRTGTFVMK